MTVNDAVKKPELYRLLLTVEAQGPEGNRQIGDAIPIMSTTDFETGQIAIRAMAQGPNYARLLDQAINLLERVLMGGKLPGVEEMILIRNGRALLRTSAMNPTPEKH